MLLGGQVQQWATPTTVPYNESESLEGWELRRQQQQAKGINGNGMSTPLPIQVKQWAMPNARDWKNEDETTHEGHSPTLSRQVAMIARAGLLGSSAVVLHPEFHVALQGFPRGWNDFERPVTASFLSWRREHTCLLRAILSADLEASNKGSL